MSPKSRLILSRPFVVFSLFMALKIYVTWIVIFDYSFKITPLLASIPSVWVAFCLIELFVKRRKLLVYLLVNIAITSIYFAAIMYYKYYGVIVSYHALQQANQLLQVKSSVVTLMHPYFLLIYVDVVVIALCLLFYRPFRKWGKQIRIRVPRGVTASTLVIALSLSLINIWSNHGIVNEIKKAEQMGIVNYEVYTVLAGMKKEVTEPIVVKKQDVDELKQRKKIEHPAYYGIAEDKHIFVIQLESFQKFLIDLEIEGTVITPVLNELKNNSLYFSKVYQQVGQGNTSDSEFMLNTSLYIPPNGAASQTYTHKKIKAFPTLLNKLGYTSVTFHTNDAVFWNREEMYRTLGFDQYYDVEFFGEDDFVLFGASDEVLYEQAEQELLQMHEAGDKIYANLIAMTSHHPYNLPEDKRRIELPEEFDDTLVGDYLIAANYADHALGLFIDQLKESGLWEESVVVIYGDHMGLPMYSLTKYEKLLIESLLGHEYNYQDMLNIPLFIAMGDTPPFEPSEQTQLGGHVDFMPTIANLVGLSLENHIYFGQDLLNEKNNLLPMRYYLPTGSFINEEMIFIPGEEFIDGDIFPFGQTDVLHPLTEFEEDYERALQLLKLSHQYIESLPSIGKQ